MEYKEYKGETRTCVEPDCKEDFFVSAYWKEQLAKKGYGLPKRCEDCRERRRKESNSPFGDLSRKMRNNKNYMSKRRGNQRRIPRAHE